MPRKGSVSDEAETAPVLTPFEESNVAYCVAKDVVDDIIDRGGDELYEHYLQAKEIVLAARRTVEEMNDIIRSAFLIRDEGEAANESEWVEDNEPTPANTDSWARGAVRLCSNQRVCVATTQTRVLGYPYNHLTDHKTPHQPH